MTYTTNVKAMALLSGIALGSLQLAACGDDGETTPPDNTPDSSSPRSGSGGRGGRNGGGTPDSGPQAGSRADSGAPGGGTSDSGAAGSGTDASTPTCPEDPETNEEFLDRCNDSQCEPFDNQERITHPDYVEGEPLPDDYP